jgi:hypothetical protein
LFLFVAAFVIVKNSWVDAKKFPRSGLELQPSNVQFGTISQGTVEGTSTVSNTSDEQITIDFIIESCGCTQAVLERGILSPGASRKISFQWDTRGRRGYNETSIGIVYFTEKNATKRVVALTLTAKIIPDFDVIPNKLIFLSEEQKSQTFSLKSTSNSEIQIQNAVVDHPAFTAVVEADQKTVTVSYNPKLRIDNVRNLSVQITTTSKNESAFQVPINIVIY